MLDLMKLQKIINYVAINGDVFYNGKKIKNKNSDIRGYEGTVEKYIVYMEGIDIHVSYYKFYTLKSVITPLSFLIDKYFVVYIKSQNYNIRFKVTMPPKNSTIDLTPLPGVFMRDCFVSLDNVFGCMSLYRLDLKSPPEVVEEELIRMLL